MAEGKGDLVPLCGLWLTKSKDGKQYMSGRLGNAKVFVFRNRKKGERGNEKQPDYYVMMGEWQRAEGERGGPPRREDDDVPF